MNLVMTYKYRHYIRAAKWLIPLILLLKRAIGLFPTTQIKFHSIPGFDVQANPTILLAND